ncbi:MAG: class II aldolase/adducin family protein [Candidatus Gastranaerophilaceae bacterium]|nr:class II aldolase/adducin family protein [bacterium]CDE91491.1 class II aldolase/adducin family protein [Fusobacterium sp. CAG:815]DAA91134.1 MAG TPA: aldolase [Candidatus Gastranaerophilales bacterium HUM_7]DAA91922.1 MAG TPA: aldolase [Candidatus Gastranaerophilales bacterium HUM_6]DAB04233.1 MAG TPA: aldolase [Candidatus Gastranaerophilales bacterium HUM_12]DAB07751.1 MAG TPA: aldolase [Candidatus Gastranaerophilales bacterium HUM_14]
MFEDKKNELIEYGRMAGDKNYTPGISGNLSARCGDMVVITSSGVANGYLTENDFAVVDFDGNAIEGEKPSSERMLHIEFYKKRPEMNYVMHVHSPYLTAFASAGIALDDKISPEIIYCFEKIPLAEYSIPGSKELVEKTSKYFENYDVVLMANHGVIIAGKDIKDAFYKLDLCENYAKTVICAKLLGGAKILPEEEVEKIYLLRQK